MSESHSKCMHHLKAHTFSVMYTESACFLVKHSWVLKYLNAIGHRITALYQQIESQGIWAILDIGDYFSCFFWISSIIHNVYWTYELLDNPANVRFRRDAGKRASRRNRTSARLSNFTRFGWVSSITPTFSMGPIQNVHRFECIALKAHAVLDALYSKCMHCVLSTVHWI